jgi:hypothetical protein
MAMGAPRACLKGPFLVLQKQLASGFLCKPPVFLWYRDNSFLSSLFAVLGMEPRAS